MSCIRRDLEPFQKDVFCIINKLKYVKINNKFQKDLQQYKKKQHICEKNKTKAKRLFNLMIVYST